MDPQLLLRCAVADAVLAPSTHNTQPWRFHLVGDELELCADLGRHLRVIDPDARQLVMSCGAALYNLRLSLRAAGHADVVYPFPAPSRPALLARIRVGAPIAVSDLDRALAAAIPLRRTQRRAFATRPIGATITEELAALAAREGAALTRLAPSEKQLVAELVAFADRRQLSARRYRRELARWLVPAWSARRDGIPLERKEYGGRQPLAVAALARPRLGARFGAIERTRIVGAPAIVILSTASDDPASWLAGGQALEAVLLRLTSLGLAASFVNQVLELPDLRPRIAALAPAAGHPQLILRIGHGAYEHPAPRRPLSEVLDEP